MAKKKHSLGNRELSVLHIVWDKGEVTVREVFKEILRTSEIAYTTILTVMKNLEQKGMLKHRTENRANIYQATVSRDEIQRSLLKDFLASAFQNSSKDLVNALVRDNMSRDELTELLGEVDSEGK